MRISAEYLGANGWLLEFNNVRVLIDPWLTGDLLFAPGAWLIKGSLSKAKVIPSDINLILLTQGLADHTHIPTLKLMPNDIHVIAPKSSERILKQLGFTNLKIIRHGEVTHFLDLQIQTTCGAPVPRVENGYILKDSQASIYIEPHGYVDEKLTEQKLDAVITPIVDLVIPLLGSFICGSEAVIKLEKLFKPKFILSTAIDKNIKFNGLLSKVIQQKGSILEARTKVGSQVTVIDSKEGETYIISEE